jgi:hypothetical protein
LRPWCETTWLARFGGYFVTDIPGKSAAWRAGLRGG